MITAEDHLLDHEELAEVMTAMRPSIFNLVKRLGGRTPQDAEDYFQEIYLRIERNLGNPELGVCMKGVSNYVRDAIKNEHWRNLKKKKKHPVIALEQLPAEGRLISDTKSKKPLEILVDQESVQTADLAFIMYLDRVSAAYEWLRKSHPDNWNALILRERDNLSYKAIASKLDLDLHNIKMKLFRGRQYIQRFVEEEFLNLEKNLLNYREEASANGNESSPKTL